MNISRKPFDYGSDPCFRILFFETFIQCGSWKNGHAFLAYVDEVVYANWSKERSVLVESV